MMADVFRLPKDPEARYLRDPELMRAAKFDERVPRKNLADYYRTIRRTNPRMARLIFRTNQKCLRLTIEAAVNSLYEEHPSAIKYGLAALFKD